MDSPTVIETNEVIDGEPTFALVWGDQVSRAVSSETGRGEQLKPKHSFLARPREEES